MRTLLLSLVAFVFAAIAFTSCEPVYYKPNRVNAPLLNHAGQVEACVASNNTQAAFSPYEHLGIMGGFSHFARTDDNTFGRERANLFELGVGYYGNIDTPRTGRQSGWIYDIYGGYGFGWIHVNNNPAHPSGTPTFYPSMNVSRAFLQPGIGIRTRVIEFAFNWRFCNVHYSELDVPGIPTKTPLEGRDYLFSEPAVTFRLGYKAVKFEMQFVNSTPISRVDWNRSGASLNVGMHVIIGGYK